MSAKQTVVACLIGVLLGCGQEEPKDPRLQLFEESVATTDAGAEHFRKNQPEAAFESWRRSYDSLRRALATKGDLPKATILNELARVSFEMRRMSPA